MLNSSCNDDPPPPQSVTFTEAPGILLPRKFFHMFPNISQCSFSFRYITRFSKNRFSMESSCACSMYLHSLYPGLFINLALSLQPVRGMPSSMPGITMALEIYLFVGSKLLGMLSPSPVLTI